MGTAFDIITGLASVGAVVVAGLAARWSSKAQAQVQDTTRQVAEMQLKASREADQLRADLEREATEARERSELVARQERTFRRAVKSIRADVASERREGAVELRAMLEGDMLSKDQKQYVFAIGKPLLAGKIPGYPEVPNEDPTDEGKP